MAKRTIYMDNYGQEDAATTSSSRSRSVSNPGDANNGLITFFQGVIQEARTLVSTSRTSSTVKTPTIEKKL